MHGALAQEQLGGDLAVGPSGGFLVARAGVEPATFRFSGGRSYQLSYLAVARERATITISIVLGRPESADGGTQTSHDR